jgi:dTMP kinase
MNKGKFIVVEGIEGAGKSSAINVIEAVLQKHNIAFIKTREPGGTPLAEALRDIVKSASHDEELTQETELFLMYASRSQLMANRILPALAQGTWVIGDRHDLSL